MRLLGKLLETRIFEELSASTENPQSRTHSNPPEEQPAIAFLASSYEQVMARDAVLIQTIFTLVGIAATAIGGILLGLKEFDPTARGLQSNPWVYLAVPLVPITLFGLLVFLTYHINFLAQYSHALERHMADFAGHRLSSEELRVRGLSAEVPSFLRLSSRIFGAGRSRHTWIYNLSLLTIVSAVGLLLLTVPVIKLWPLPRRFQIGATAYIPIILLLFCGLMRSWRPNRGLLRDTLVDVVAEPRPRGEGTERRLSSYLAAPRTVDHFFKLLVAMTGVILGRLALSKRTGAAFLSKDTLTTSVLVVGVLEYLLYQARYTWNDLRDLPIDAEHTRRRERRRIPTPITRNGLKIIWLSIPVKIALAVATVTWVAPQHAGRFFWGGIGIWASAVLYDGLRQRSRQRLRCSTLSAGRPRHSLDRVSTSISWAVCGLVGSGYAVRMITALEVGSDGRVSLGIALLFGGTMWLSEVATVTMSWALEGMESLRRRSTATMRGEYDPGLRMKAHLVLMLRQAGLIRGEAEEEGVKKSNVPAVIGSLKEDTVPAVTIWKVAGAAGFITAAVAGVVASAGMSFPGSKTLWLAGLAGVPAVGQCFLRWGSPTGFLLSAAVLGAVGVDGATPYPWLGPLLFLILGLVYHQTERGTYDLIVGWWDDVTSALRGVGRSIASLFAALRRWIRGGWRAEDYGPEVIRALALRPPRDVFVQREGDGSDSEATT
ncbi:MAG: hypothetical protein M3256_17910 [Actinomycetota bacterium]|nr:hypothetical protein [Actinomycetota bacterium]